VCRKTKKKSETWWGFENGVCLASRPTAEGEDGSRAVIPQGKSGKKREGRGGGSRNIEGLKYRRWKRSRGAENGPLRRKAGRKEKLKTWLEE